MNILINFIDMINTAELSLYNPLNKNTQLDDLLIERGGLLFRNTFTQGADTTRSLAQFWSGCNIGLNGVHHTGDSPNIFLSKDSFLLKLNKLGYSIYIYSSEYKKFSLPPESKSLYYVNENENLDEFLEYVDSQISEGSKSVTYIDIHDYHWSIDDYGANEKGISNGFIQVSNTLKIIYEHLKYIDLDIMFSDHGHLYTGEFESTEKVIENILNESRIRTLFNWNINPNLKKELIINNGLRSIMDISVSILDITGFNYKDDEFNGISINRTELSHSYQFSENSSYMYRKEFNQIDVWKVFNMNGSIEITRNGKIEIKGTIDFDSAIKYLEANSQSFRYYNLSNIQSKQPNSGTKLDIESNYTNGTKRLRNRKSLVLLRKLLPYNNKITSSIRLLGKKLRDKYYRKN